VGAARAPDFDFFFWNRFQLDFARVEPVPGRARVDLLQQLNTQTAFASSSSLWPLGYFGPVTTATSSVNFTISEGEAYLRHSPIFKSALAYARHIPYHTVGQYHRLT
jgi:hypothetical protein